MKYDYVLLTHQKWIWARRAEQRRPKKRLLLAAIGILICEEEENKYAGGKKWLICWRGFPGINLKVQIFCLAVIDGSEFCLIIKGDDSLQKLWRICAPV